MTNTMRRCYTYLEVQQNAVNRNMFILMLWAENLKYCKTTNKLTLKKKFKKMFIKVNNIGNS